MIMSKQIEVIEVGPRDGFQSVKCTPPIPTEIKLDVIDRLVAAGVKHIEYTSFVSPKAIPQLADAKAVTEVVLKKYPDLDLFLAEHQPQQGQHQPHPRAVAGSLQGDPRRLPRYEHRGRPGHHLWLPL